ncbi:Anoctamin-6 [Dissophora ornata]|nr:Anoctamin-6 [Dissophora ornata]
MIFKTWCRHHIGDQYATVIATAMFNLIIIIILGEIWCRLAEWPTDKENLKYTDAYEASFIIKRYLFDFINIEDLQDTCQYDACITELTVQLAVVFVGKQLLNGLFEMVFSKKILADQALKRRKFLEARKRTRAPQWVKDDDFPSYEVSILKCFRKSVIQFGFCTLFVTSFPVAPAFALINNLIDIRMEATRLLTQYRRPVALRAKDIGMREKIMEFVSFISVITNATIIAFSSLWVKEHIFIDHLHANDDGGLLAARLRFILVFEHVVFLFKFILRASIPSVPLTIKLAVQRSKYITRVASEGVDSDVDDDEIDLDFDSGSQSDYEGDDEVSGYSSASAYTPARLIGTLEDDRRRTSKQMKPCNENVALAEDRVTAKEPGNGLRWLWKEKILRKISPKSPQENEAQTTSVAGKI